jgi:hypothetical protein
MAADKFIAAPAEFGLAHADQDGPNSCLSCGTTEGMRRKRYCSIACRQRLRYKLQVRTGLLRALNTRYASFHFDARIIVLDLMPYGTREIYSFLFPRLSKTLPADDFSRMADVLGNVWWSERRRTNRKYLASQSLLRQARQRPGAEGRLMPEERRQPSLDQRCLVHLKIQREALDSPQLEQIVKQAYRRQAKRHHPDLGGSAVAFRRLHQAYEALMAWAENPSFYKRRGFPDKWFYDGSTNRWVQPIPCPQSIAQGRDANC